MPRTKQRTPELRDRVLAEALAVLAGDGVAGFTTRRVAAQAATSPPAVYELFGDKPGLVRAVFFAGFAQLAARFEALAPVEDPVEDIRLALATYRGFVRDNPVLAEVMFARPFADFDPAPSEQAAGAAVREAVVARVRRAVDAGAIAGEPVDVAHVLLAVAQGLAAQETAGWLGTSAASVERRWSLAADTVLRGLAPSVTTAPAGGPRSRART